MKPPVPFTVYLQALGGKFLGPNAFNYANIQLSLQYSKGTVSVPYKVIQGVTNDGIFSTSFNSGSSSFLPILTTPLSAPGNPVVNYLTHNADTVSGKTSIVLPEAMELAILYINVPTPSGKSMIFSQTVLLDPQLTSYKVTVVVPGLLLITNTNVVVPPNTLSVYVAMMCGCKITTGLPVSYWTYTDFEVSALVSYMDGRQEKLAMSFDKKINLSTFTVSPAGYKNIVSAIFSACQKSTNNYGVAAKRFG
jgi:hypothetical protein